jgi:hypothetical protein
MRSLMVCTLFLASAAGWAAPASAQTFGAKGGLDLTNVVDVGFASDATASFGGTVGGFVSVRLFRGLSVAGEALYTIERTKISSGVEDRLTYFEVPGYLSYRVWGSPEGMRASVIGGGFYRSLIDATEIISGASSPIKEAIASSDYGALIGVQVDLKPRWVVEARYMHGMTDIYNQFRAPRAGQHRTFQITVAYRVRK